jgi:mannose-6-phosphate isomerase-like protein (cupin superfamily)
MSDFRTALRRCVGDVDRFAVEFWGRRPLVCRARGSFEDLLSSASVADLLELSARRPTMRMVLDGKMIAPAEYTKTVRMGGQPIPEVADDDRIADQLALGATLVLQSLERVHPPIRAFVHALQTEMSHPVQANAYLSPPNASGLARHEDSHDVIVIQIEGVKSWDIEGVGSIEVDPGDVVYIPRGCAHGASTATRHSLHLTIGITAINIGDVVRRALNSTAVDLRQPLPIGFAYDDDDQSFRDTIAKSFESVALDLASRDYDDIARSERSRIQDASRQQHRLRSQLDSFAITDATHLRRILAIGLHVSGDRAVLEATDLHMRMPVAAIDALRTVAANTMVTVGQLEGLDAAGRMVLARRLLREGVVEIVPSSER